LQIPAVKLKEQERVNHPSTSAALNGRRKIVIDQDAHGPASTNLQSILMLLAAEGIDILGICVVSGDGWCAENVAHTLRLLEIAGRIEVPVVRGAVLPLVNDRQRTASWEALHGPLFWKGAWTTHFFDGRYREGEHHDRPEFVPELKEGHPAITAVDGSAAEFLVKTVRRHPGEVTIWAAGPLTNLALATRLDPEFASLAKELVFMGGSFNPVPADNHFALEYLHAPRREFNMRWDPEAASLVLKAPWRAITQVPVDATTRAFWSAEHQKTVGVSSAPWASYLARFGRQLPMWDEVAAAIWLDPSLVTRRERLLVDIDTSFTAGYGNTLSWPLGKGPGNGEPAVDVVKDIDLERFDAFALELLKGNRVI
jgi:inosine-uridine nucleoside N-ribohydrolase